MADNKMNIDEAQERMEEILGDWWDAILQRFHEEGQVSQDDLETVIALHSVSAVAGGDGFVTIPTDGLALISLYIRGDMKKSRGRPRRSLSDDETIRSAKSRFELLRIDGKTVSEALSIVADEYKISDARAGDWVYKQRTRPYSPYLNKQIRFNRYRK